MSQTNTPAKNIDTSSDYVSEEKEVLINVNRVTRVVQGGRRFRFQALVVVGNGANKVGVGVGKASDVQSASAKASKVARKNMITFHINPANDSIPHEVRTKKAGSKILLKPASLGTGVIAGGTVRSVLSVTGVNNILAKSLGSSNKINTAYATIDALTQLVPYKDWQTAGTHSKKAEPKSSEK